MELLQFAYFNRTNRGVIGVDTVDEMLEVCKENMFLAEQQNHWFKKEFIDFRKGDALNLPVDDNSIDVAAQNCLFNIFKEKELKKALTEMFRVLKSQGKLVLSDPICADPIPKHLRDDSSLRGLCLSGALPLQDYIDLLTGVGFGTIEIRARRPYRILDPSHYDTNSKIYIESVEVCAIKDPMPEDGPCVFTGKAAIYIGNEPYFDDEKGHVLMYNQPLEVCDKTANNLSLLGRRDIYITKSTYFYNGGGCC